MRIDVTAEDIRDGVPGDDCKCPVARACIRAGLPDGLSVGGERSDAVAFQDEDEEDGWRVYRLPREVLAFIDAFDDAVTRSLVAPITFELEGFAPPTPSMERP